MRTCRITGVTGALLQKWVDRETCVISTGSRCNRSGYDQVAEELRRMGVSNILHMQQPYSNIHIDGLMNTASHDTVLVHASQVPYDVLNVLKKKGYKILEAPSTTEVRSTFACNFVALEPGLVVMPEGNPRTQGLLEDNVIRVIPVDVSEIL